MKTKAPTFAFCLLPFALSRHRRDRGQALLIAVLVLFAVATLAALFTALIGSQLAQVSRQSDVVALRNIAEAGLRLANEQLAYSPQGADWRPSTAPYSCGDGQAALMVSYGPNPADVQSRFLRITSTASYPNNPFLRHIILALKPVLLTDNIRFITDRFETNQPATLGVSGLELAGGSRDDYVTYLEGPIRSNTDLEWCGKSQLTLRTTFDQSVDWFGLGLLRDDRVEVAGEMRTGTGWTAQDYLNLRVDPDNAASPSYTPANYALDNLFTQPGGGDYLEYYANGFSRYREAVLAQNMIANSQAVVANLNYLTPSSELANTELHTPRIQPPLLDAVHPDKDQNRYLILTRDAGKWEPSAISGWYNTGEYGWGWTNFGGIYIDNGSYVSEAGQLQDGDIQYDHDLRKLQANWARSLGMYEEDGDARAATGLAHWWDKTARYYAPPGVEIILHGEAACPYVEIIRHDAKISGGQYYYWRQADGTIIPSALEPPKTSNPALYTAPAGGCAPALPPTGYTSYGIYDGNRAVFPFPPNGVIYTEGNVRVRGIMPPLRDSNGGLGANVANPEEIGYFTSTTGAGGRTRRFDLQIVSGGTVYIEGDLLDPGSALLGGLYPRGHASYSDTNEKNCSSRLALLARDSVCVNTTALNPRPANLYHVVSGEYYNDAQPAYTSSGNEGYLLFEGPDAGYSFDTWPGTPIATDPALIDMIYFNTRLQVAALSTTLPSNLHLLISHSGLYVGGAVIANNPIGAPGGEPSLGTTGTPPDDPAVEIELYHNSTQLTWAFGGTTYRFVRSAVATPSSADESSHWYTDTDVTQLTYASAATEDWLELLPNSYQTMLLHSTTSPNLTGEDTFQFVSRVSPVRYYDTNMSAYTDWQIPPKDLAYVLGPVAVAPFNRTAAGEAVPPLPVEIDALIYAQNGSWFVLPGRWFNDDPDTLEGTAGQVPYYHEPLNIRISVYGAISENMPADQGAVTEWSSKWGGPVDQGAAGFLSYRFDPILRAQRTETERGYLRFPNFPITTDLVVWGERITGAAGS